MTHYDLNYYRICYPNIFYDDEEYDFYSKIRQKSIFKNIDIENKKILDFGCGLGVNIYNLKNAVGYDISKDALYFCSLKNIKTIKHLRRKFDIIIISEVLEHTKKPYDILKNLKNKLNKNGIIILELPLNTYSLDCDYRENEIHQHFYDWMPQTIFNLATNLNFEVLEIDNVHYSRFTSILRFFYNYNFNLAYKLLNYKYKNAIRVLLKAKNDK